LSQIAIDYAVPIEALGDDALNAVLATKIGKDDVPHQTMISQDERGSRGPAARRFSLNRDAVRQSTERLARSILVG
jgi:hypothetical protein